MVHHNGRPDIFKIGTKYCAEELVKMDFDGYSIGGTSVGSIVAALYAMGYKPYYIYVLFKKYAEEIGINKKVTPHILRHSYATRSIEAGIPAVVLQKLMGHSDVKITLNTYTSIFNDFKLDEINKVNAYYERNNLLDDKEDVR